jgi:hypothetical protein
MQKASGLEALFLTGTLDWKITVFILWLISAPASAKAFNPCSH